MSEGMPASSWKSLSAASSRLSSFKGYLTQHDSARLNGPRCAAGTPDGRQGWKEWAGQKIKTGRTQSSSSLNSGDGEKLSLFPGWAVRRYRKVGMEDAFEVDVFVSGFASSHRPQELASRSQRAFIRLAKGFASLPKLVADAAESDNRQKAIHLTPSTEQLLSSIQLPPRPTEITEDYEIQALETQFQRANTNATTQASLDLDSPVSSRSSSIDIGFETASPATSVNPSPPSITFDPRRLHANLESRLQPFWSSVLPGRTVRIHLFASPHEGTKPNLNFYPQGGSRNETDPDAVDYGPVASTDVITAADGSFQARFRVNWEDMCQHPAALHIAFGEPQEEHDLLVAAELLSVPPSPQSSISSSSDEFPNSATESKLHSTNVNLSSGTLFPPQISPHPSFAATTLRISLTHSPVRVISDIDDTIKLSNILSGARAVFHNVFVKELNDTVIPGMGEWYSDMWTRGVRFHYVSNGPFELLPVLSEFFKVSRLPPGSIKLRSYAGRSLFNGLLSAPATRKRAGIQEILDSFPDSRFILIGDTGEQDLELYSEFARERPDQILGIFVRDAGGTTGEVIDDPTGLRVIGAGTGTNSVVPGGTVRPPPRRTLSGLLTSSTPKPKSTNGRTPPPLNIPSDIGYFTAAPLSAEPERMYGVLNMPNTTSIRMPPSSTSDNATTPTSVAASTTSFQSSHTTSSGTSTSSANSKVFDAERKRYELQIRVNKARTQMPGHVPLRVFREPGECVEVAEILKKAGV